MEKTFGTFKNNTVSEHFRKMRFCYLTPSLCTPKMMTVLEHFRKMHFCYLTPPTTAPQTDTRYLIKRTSERFGKMTLLLPYSFPLHCTPKVTPAISKIEHPNISERYPFVTLYSPPPPLHPKMTLAIS